MLNCVKCLIFGTRISIIGQYQLSSDNTEDSVAVSPIIIHALLCSTLYCDFMCISGSSIPQFLNYRVQILHESSYGQSEQILTNKMAAKKQNGHQITKNFYKKYRRRIA